MCKGNTAANEKCQGNDYNIKIINSIKSKDNWLNANVKTNDEMQMYHRKPWFTKHN